MGGMLNSVHFFSLAESLPGKERSLSVGCCCCCNLMYQHYQRLSTGDYMGLLERALVVMTALCLEEQH